MHAVPKDQPKSGPILQPRDLEVLRGLFESRILERRHITALYFDGRDEMAKKRLAILQKAGWIREQNPKRPPSVRAIYCLARSGLERLVVDGHLREFEARVGRHFAWDALQDRHIVSAQTVGHELAIADVKAAFAIAARASGTFSVLEFSTWPPLFAFRADERRLKPDAFIRIAREVDGAQVATAFFLELDRHSESHPRLLEKIDAYRGYLRDGAFSRFLTGSAEARASFRVLFVFSPAHTSATGMEQRLWNTAHWLSSPVGPTADGLFRSSRTPVRTLAFLAAAPDVLRDPFGTVWISPEDYAAALRGTPYDPACTDWVPVVRESERDRLARERVQRRPLHPPARENA